MHDFFSKPFRRGGRLSEAKLIAKYDYFEITLRCRRMKQNSQVCNQMHHRCIVLLWSLHAIWLPKMFCVCQIWLRVVFVWLFMYLWKYFAPGSNFNFISLIQVCDFFLFFYNTKITREFEKEIRKRIIFLNEIKKGRKKIKFHLVMFLVERK